ncbi:hypothetical protein [Cellulosilyticum sp. I15G10I2]|uniref:hypothetical protein n=1 Tax=Cellulosilyticum sp. I15G10I2 TaxID=1892843 RepID=UPI00085C02C5|nr:hypothetical protein [Cellulosilyticum sp. I15G10I2]
MNNHKTAGVEDEDKIFCNCCGKEIAKTAIVDTHTDYLHIEKSWGYFSSKDLTTHSFNICEKCYDNWIESFIVPVEDVYIEDVYFYSEEELKLLNEAYHAELCK